MRSLITSWSIGLLVAFATRMATGETVTLVVSDPSGAGSRVGAPVSMEVDLVSLLGERVDPDRLRLVEITDGSDGSGASVPAQFEPASAGSLRGVLWWAMPPGEEGERRFHLVVGREAVPPALRVRFDQTHQRVDVFEGDLPVLRYNHGATPLPEGTPAHFAPGESYPRGDYIHPLYGPDGEVLTEDYPRDHPHHRGVWWSWPVTRWRDTVYDIWAVVGVHARPVAVRRLAAGQILVAIEAESTWMWEDKEPIVREQVLIRAFRQHERNRFIDVHVSLTGLVDGVAIGGRPKAGYGGFSLRTAPCQQRRTILHTDPPRSQPRRAWLDYAGVFAGGRGRSGVTIFEHVVNPDYPNPLHEYLECNCVMPAYPADREVPLQVGENLILRHRLWIRSGDAGNETFTDVWTAYAQPPTVTIDE